MFDIAIVDDDCVTKVYAYGVANGNLWVIDCARYDNIAVWQYLGELLVYGAFEHVAVDRGVLAV